MGKSPAREQKVSSISRRSRITRLGAPLALLSLAGAAAYSEVRYRRELAADPLTEQLKSPLGGTSLDVVSADGTLLHAELYGDQPGRPTVVLVPGWTEQLAVWNLIIRRLVDRGFRVAAYDLRGQGLSGLPADADQRIERYGEDLEAVLIAVGAGVDHDDVIVAGHSMGGMSIMAWAAAVDASSRVRAAALVNTGAFELVTSSTLLPAFLPLAVRRAVGDRVVLGGAPAPVLSNPLTRAVIRYAAFGPTASPAQVALLARMDAACPPAVRRAAGATLGLLDVRVGVGALQVPTLVVTGTNDRLTPPVLAQQLVESLPNLTDFLLLPQTGHMSLLERPDELADALTRLATGVGLEPRPV